MRCGFDNFRIDLGSYVSEVLKPVVEQIDEIMQPLDPLIEFLSLRGAADFAGGADAGPRPDHVLSLIGLFGDGAEKAVVEFIEIVMQIRQVVKDITNSPGDSRSRSASARST